MRKNFKIILCNLKSIVSIKKLLIICIIFVFTFSMKISYLDNTVNLSVLLKSVFYGPNNLLNNIIVLFTWSLYEFYLIYIIGDYFYKELTRRGMYTISRIGNKTRWHICMQLSLFLVCLTYYLIGIIVGLILVYYLNIQIVICDIYHTLNIFFILGLSSYFSITLYILITILIKDHNVSFLILVVVSYLSIEFGNTFKVDMFIALNQGILSKHYESNFSFLWSYIYLLILIIFNIVIINRVIIRNDLLTIID